MHSLLRLAFVGALCLSMTHASGQTRSVNPILAIGTPFESNDWIQFKAELELPAITLFDEYKSAMGLAPDDGMQLVASKTDRLGYTRHQFQQTYRDIPVEFALYNIHAKEGIALKGNGNLAKDVNLNAQPRLTSTDALALAVECIGAESYYWENDALEAAKQNATDDPNATFYPEPELLIADKDFNPENEESYRLVWKFEIFSAIPEGRDWVYVDAQSGEIMKELSLDLHGNGNPGTAVTRYSGTRQIITDSTENGYVLRDYTRSRGVETYDAVDSFDLQYATDFIDDDNFWDHDNDRADDAATDAHWATEMLYDYLGSVHGRDSYDDLGTKMICYVHAGQNWRNAQWLGFWARFGDASGEPWTFIDVVAHEFGHGVIWTSAGLIYSRESGALNESFCDILGESLQHFIFDSTDWHSTPAPIDTLRSLSNPKAYGDPDTYLGENWVTTAGDNYGVHTNSGVQNHWFYLLSEGGMGTNDNGDDFTVEGIGLQTAMAVMMRNLTTYLTPNSGYYDARQGALFAAEDLFGSCSFEYQQVANAWHAVGVGPRQDATDFSVIGVDRIELCNVNDSELVTMYIKHMGCDSSGPVTLDLTMLKSNSPTVRKITLDLPSGMGPGEILAYTFEEEFNFSKPGEHFLTGRVEFSGDPYEKNNTSTPVIVYKPTPVNDQVFTFYTNFLPRTFRDSIAFISNGIVKADVLKFVGKDSTTGILVEGDRLRLGSPVPEGEDLFDYNTKLGAQICFCIDATALDSLGLQFDLRQTYSNELEETVGYEQPPTSAIRVLVDGLEISRYTPETNNEDDWQTHNVDLESQLGNEFTLCFDTRTIQSLLDSKDTIGDRVFLDNIAFISSEIESSTKFGSKTLPLRIYPNPTNAVAFIEIESTIAGPAEVIILNINGQVMSKNTAHLSGGENIIDLDVNNFEPGVYIVEVRSENDVYTGKIVVQ